MPVSSSTVVTQMVLVPDMPGYSTCSMMTKPASASGSSTGGSDCSWRRDSRAVRAACADAIRRRGRADGTSCRTSWRRARRAPRRRSRALAHRRRARRLPGSCSRFASASTDEAVIAGFSLRPLRSGSSQEQTAILPRRTRRTRRTTSSGAQVPSVPPVSSVVRMQFSRGVNPKRRGR